MNTVYVDWDNKIIVTGKNGFIDELNYNDLLQEKFENFLCENFTMLDLFDITDEHKKDIINNFFDCWLHDFAEKKAIV